MHRFVIEWKQREIIKFLCLFVNNKVYTEMHEIFQQWNDEDRMAQTALSNTQLYSVMWCIPICNEISQEQWVYAVAAIKHTHTHTHP